MVATERRQLKPIWPDLSNLDWQRASFKFDRRGDTLSVDFFGDDRGTASVPLTAHVLAMVDPATEAVRGLQIDGLLADAIREVPDLLALADVIGLTPAEIAQAVSRPGMDWAARSEAVVWSILDRLAPKVAYELSAAERDEHYQRVMRARAEPAVRFAPPSGPAHEMAEWLAIHPEILGEYGFEWVAVADRRVVAHGEDFATVAQDAHAAGHDEPLLVPLFPPPFP